MCQALQELMKDDIEEKIDGAKKGVSQSLCKPSN